MTKVFKPELKAKAVANDTVSLSPPGELNIKWNQVHPRIVFTIDFGIESLVFLRIDNSKDLKLMVVWKQSPNDYRLSYSGRVASGETTLSRNVEVLLNSTEFQTYLNDQVDQFIKQEGTKNADSQPLSK